MVGTDVYICRERAEKKLSASTPTVDAASTTRGSSAVDGLGTRSHHPGGMNASSMVDPTTRKGVISEKLKRLRTARGLTQSAIAKKLDITQAGWSALERGERNPSHKLLQRIVVTLQVSADWLLLDRGTDGEGNHTDDQTSIPAPFATQAFSGVWLVPVVDAIPPGVAAPGRHAREHATASLPVRASDVVREGDADEIDAERDLFGLRIDESRVEAELHPGDVVVCVETASVAAGDDVWVYRLSTGDVLLRRLTALNHDANTVSLQGADASQPADRIALDSDDGFGRVCGVWRARVLRREDARRSGTR